MRLRAAGGGNEQAAVPAAWRGAAYATEQAVMRVAG